MATTGASQIRLYAEEPEHTRLRWLRTLFPNYHLGADRLDMAHAVEVRMPFLDHVLFEAVCQVPSAVLARGGPLARSDFLEHSWAARLVLDHRPALYRPAPVAPSQAPEAQDA